MATSDSTKMTVAAGTPEAANVAQARLIAAEAQRILAGDRSHLGGQIYVNDLVWALQQLASPQLPTRARLLTNAERMAVTDDLLPGTTAWSDALARMVLEVNGLSPDGHQLAEAAPALAALPRLQVWQHRRATGDWPGECPDWAKDCTGRFNPTVAAQAVISELEDALATPALAQCALHVAAARGYAFDFNPDAVRVYRSRQAVDLPHDGTPASAVSAAIHAVARASLIDRAVRRDTPADRPQREGRTS